MSLSLRGAPAELHLDVRGVGPPSTTPELIANVLPVKGTHIVLHLGQCQAILEIVKVSLIVLVRSTKPAKMSRRSALMR